KRSVRGCARRRKSKPHPSCPSSVGPGLEDPLELGGLPDPFKVGVRGDAAVVLEALPTRLAEDLQRFACIAVSPLTLFRGPVRAGASGELAGRLVEPLGRVGANTGGTSRGLGGLLDPARLAEDPRQQPVGLAQARTVLVGERGGTGGQVFPDTTGRAAL